MPTLKKLIVISVIMLASLNLFAEQVIGTGTPWGVKGTSTATSNYGFLGYDAYGVFGKCISAGNYGYLGSAYYGVCGRHSSGNYGVLGCDFYGAFGEHDSGNIGYLGSMYYGAYGRNYSSNNYGYLGSDSYGAYGRNTSGNYAYLGASTEALKAYAATTGSYAGNLTHASGSCAYIAGNYYGALIMGPNTNYVCIGTAAIGITASSSSWAGNFEGDVIIDGDLYVTGDKDNVIKLDDGTWMTMSATEAPYPEYTISGRAKLSNGSVRIEFEEPYPEVISSQIPIKVIVTPEGSSSVIYVKDVSVNGFTAASEIGDVNATFSWMAIARVKGKEQRTDYQAVTAKMLRLEAAQRELGIGSQSLKPSVNPEESDEAEVLEVQPELSLSAPELSATGNVTIGYQLPKAGNVSLSVYDASGRLVKTLLSAQREQGDHSIVWNCTDASSRPVSAGIYYVRLKDGQSAETAKITIVK